MVILKSPGEIEKIRRSCRIVAKVLDEMEGFVKPGITTLEMDKLAEKIILAEGAQPAFKGYRGYPATLCASVNEEVVHGIPGSRMLREGDIIGVDCGVLLDGFYGDAAWSFPVGAVSDEVKKLLETTCDSLYAGINAARTPGRLFDISAAVQRRVESDGFSVVRDFVGHGIGRNLHEDPQVPNYGEPGRGMPLREGLVLALEPMVNVGGCDVVIDDDGWTARTRDASWSAHFEHCVAITGGEPDVLSESQGGRGRPRLGR